MRAQRTIVTTSMLALGILSASIIMPGPEGPRPLSSDLRADDRAIRADEPNQGAAVTSRPAQSLGERPQGTEESGDGTALARNEPEIPRKLYQGQVVLVREALKRRGVTAFDELDGQVALEQADGRLRPIVPDWRGRAFFQDERLRDRKVELVGVERPGIPYLQVLMVFTFDDQGQRLYTDYWCDICSIPMYEIKPCDCCQADIRLRFQPQELPAYLNTAGQEAAP